MNGLKLRFLLMGCIIAIIGIALLVKRGYSIDFVGLLGAGMVLFVIGLLWNNRGTQVASAKNAN